MGGARNPEREAQVRALNRVAHPAGVATLPENASRAKVGKLAEDLCLLALTQQQRRQVNHAIAAFRATFSASNVEARDTGAPAPAQGKVWKFSAVQLTYNSSHSDFMAHDHGVTTAYSRTCLAGLSPTLAAWLTRFQQKVSRPPWSVRHQNESICTLIFIYQLPSIDVVRMPSTSLPSKTCGHM